MLLSAERASCGVTWSQRTRKLPNCNCGFVFQCYVNLMFSALSDEIK
jgi:hypothetical protein